MCTSTGQLRQKTAALVLSTYVQPTLRSLFDRFAIIVFSAVSFLAGTQYFMVHLWCEQRSEDGSPLGWSHSLAQYIWDTVHTGTGNIVSFLAVRENVSRLEITIHT